MRVGTIGSGVIVDRMIEAMQLVDGIEVEIVYSRSLEKAKAFAQKHGIERYCDDLSQMMNDPNVDTIYVASPNALHYPQSKMALEHGKHVICEKPFTASRKETQELFDLAKEKGVYIFEAITTIHLPNYRIVKEHLDKVGQIKFVQCNFSQYSSRYGKYKEREVTNVFDPAMQGGALKDINVYCLHFVTGLFGKPETMQYIANKGFNGVDTSGVVLMTYPEMIATCVGAKDSSSPNFVIIQGDEGTLRVYGSSCGVCMQVEFIPTKGDMIGKKDTNTSYDIGIEQDPHMTYECKSFLSIIDNNDEDSYKDLCEQTMLVTGLMEDALKQIG